MRCITIDFRPNRSARIGCILLVIVYLSDQTFAFSNSTFVERCRADCSFHKDFISCGKFRVVMWLHDTVRNKEFTYGPVRIIRIPSISSQSILPKLPQSRVFKTNAIEALNFVRDLVEDLLTKRALVYTIDNSVTGRNFGSMPMIMDEDELVQIQSRKESADEWRLFKKKKSVILPILILLNLLKLKLLLLPIFLGVHFIKKLLLLASVVAPSVFSHLKICKVPQHPQHPYQTWATAAEAPVDYPTGYGHEDAWAHRNDVAYGYYGFRNPYG
ncbi:uncharacterized protein LOC114879332 [Osmia bicornis bicornis]|uniref:uncharacterized protein LOC114879332 n=1 Tax=Osmia bicornis bicornis TaxID=1437191 RepID=UPI001EAE9E75|nr:uncharacterized protein LOC114879332 [Osmia bicornis bicornis]